MRNLIQRVKRFRERFHRKDDEIAIKALFKVHYWHFKSLLRLNEHALLIMSLMEQTLQQGRPFSMPFIRSHITSLSIQVYKIIQKLNQLSADGYPGLFHTFERIQQDVETVMAPSDVPREGPLIQVIDEVSKDDAEKAGGKMAILGEIKRHIYPHVPEGFVVTVRADQEFMAHNRLRERINQIFQSHKLDDLPQLIELSGKIHQMIMHAPLPPEMAEALEDSCRKLAVTHGKRRLLAIRSSALGEDASGHSFAGLFTTELNIPPDQVPQAYKKVLAGKYTARAIAYRQHYGLRDDDALMAVGCLAMVDAVAAGVVYSRDPADMAANKLIVQAVPGLGKPVVDGIVSPLPYWIEPGPNKEWIIIRGCPAREKTNDDRFSLPHGILQSLATIARRIENYFAVPQDVEWAVNSRGRIIILQARPLQGYSTQSEPHVPIKIPAGFFPPLIDDGITAGPGVGCGTARVVTRPKDMLRFQPGEVLIVEQALPIWLVVLKRAAAVVTDTGGMVGHFATMARELGIPALFNTHKATQVIQDGRVITVDADGRKVFSGKVDTLIQKAVSPLIPFETDIPIQRTLRKVLHVVAPLNLTHPFEVDFIPEKCLTYHDIIRFSHEKAIAELFKFGYRHGCLRRLGRRLVAHIPMQLWVIDLDDEGEKAPSGAMIRLDDIASPPFLAIWKGITAVPWSGPPSPDMKGLFSVMAGSGMAPDPAAGSAWSSGNCAIISGNFCNLSLRWGYHFSVIQSFLGLNARENYVRFHFQGGAADIDRRHKRMGFIREILERYGFYAKVIHDNMTAQLEGCDADFLEKRLRLLGYLSLHIGQIDMIMGNPQRAHNLKLKMLSDITKKII